MVRKLFKTILGLFLIPVAAATAKAFYIHLSELNNMGDSLLIIERGILLYFFVHVIIIRPAYLYVVAHEFVHVLATWLCGGKVESFDVGHTGGSVATSKTNIFIELSPYFIPLYTLALGPVFLLVKFILKDHSNLNPVFLFLVGFTLAFHFVMTAEVLKVQQSDVAKSGVILSFVFIFTCNLIVVIAVFSPFFENVSFIKFIKDSYYISYDFYNIIYDKVLQLYNLIVDKVASAG